jgi:hypothetical protein
MTITANDDRDMGLPSAYSGHIDQMCVGLLDESRKLMFIAAGNILWEDLKPDEYKYHEWNCKKAGILDPGQAWNAVTVGAITEKVFIKQPAYKDWTPIATESGDLSPRSRTSLPWPEENRRKWPFKPDIVLEGGNYATNGIERLDIDDLSLLTTTTRPGKYLANTCDTSPATAAAARLAAILWSHYPKLWPETIRGLTVHSAEWTNAMYKRFPGKGKREVQRLLRCYGYGVPNMQRALWSAENAVTLIYEGELQPFKKVGSTIRANDMHLHKLPWPTEELLGLGETEIRMRVTLSYFIEPSPGRLGWAQSKHRYQSHGLRFDVNRPLEDAEQFKQRLSKAEWDDPDEAPDSVGDAQQWVIGDKGRRRGSLHADWWEGLAADLAKSDHIAVYPVTGWWKERPHRNRWNSKARYSLIVTIETPGIDVDLYTPIVNQTKIVTELET